MNYKMQVISNTGPALLNSEKATFDFSAVRIGTEQMSLYQGGTGAGAFFEFGNRALRSAFIPQNDNDLVNLVTLKTSLAALKTGMEWQDSVLDLISAPPANPSEGDRYLVGINATGAWLGKEKNIAVFTSGAWVYTAPLTGMTLRIDTKPNRVYTYEVTDWGYNQFESTTASNGCKKVGYDIQRDNTLPFVNGEVSTVQTKQVGFVKANGEIGLAGADSLAINGETLFVMVSNNGNVNAGEQGAFEVLPGGIIDGFTGLTPGREYFLDNVEGGYDLFENIDYLVNSKCVRLFKAVSATKALWCPEFRYIVLN